MASNNEKMALFLGYTALKSPKGWSIITPKGERFELQPASPEMSWHGIMCLPDYTGDDAAAINLLPMVVKRGYTNVELSHHNLCWWCVLSEIGYTKPRYYAVGTSISSAVTGAILKLIEARP